LKVKYFRFIPLECEKNPIFATLYKLGIK